jgi:hypothetical protein
MNNIGYYVLIAVIAVIILSLLHDFVSWRQRRAYWKRVEEERKAVWEQRLADVRQGSYRAAYPFHEAGR